MAAFNTHLLSMEEVWFAREHPFDVRVVKVKRLVKEIEDAENELERKRSALDNAVTDMREKMNVA